MFPTNLNRRPTQDCIRWAQSCLESNEIHCQPLPEHAHQDKHMYTLNASDNSTEYLLVESYNDVPSMLKFITLAKILRNNGIHSPQIFHQEITTHRCWVIMSHFGHETLLDWLLKTNNPIQKKEVFEHCLREIKQFQAQKIPYPIANYPTTCMIEDMTLTETHFINNLLNHPLNETEKSYLAHAKTAIAEACAQMPQTIMHFDFHSANLMLLPKRTLGILDFQDLKIGPYIYDLASLLTDHYYQHQQHEINHYIKHYYDSYLSKLQKQQQSPEAFQKQFDVVVTQRHLKNIGIFSRLFANNKQHYIKHIPAMMQQMKYSCARIIELRNLTDILWSAQIRKRFAQVVYQECKSSLSSQQMDSLLAEVEQA